MTSFIIQMQVAGVTHSVFYLFIYIYFKWSK